MSADKSRTRYGASWPADPAAPESTAVILEAGRRLASERDDLIAQGVDPAELVVPIGPLTTQEPALERAERAEAALHDMAEEYAGAQAALERVQALYGGEPPPVWIEGTKIIRATTWRRDLRCDVTESMLRVDDVRAAIRGDDV